jgi:hypothetical protein
MKLFLSIVVHLIFINNSYSQGAYGKLTVEIEIGSDSVFTSATITGAVPGGDTTWKDYILQNLNTAFFIKNGAPKGRYTVMVKYSVDNEGYISNALPLNANGYGMDAEVYRVIRRSSWASRWRRWQPASTVN